MLAHFWEFAIAVLHQWTTLVTGSFIVALIAVYEHWRGKSISGWPLWSAIIASLFFAFFFAWQNERVEVERKRAEIERLTSVERPDDLTSMTPRELVGFFADRTAAQASVLATPYTGKRMKVTGVVNEIMGPRWSDESAVAYCADENKVELTLAFDNKWTQQLLALHKGDEITVIGVIQEVSFRSVYLVKCDLVTVVRPTPAPTASVSASAAAVSPSPSSR
jgi:putative nucleic acid binding protein